MERKGNQIIPNTTKEIKGNPKRGVGIAKAVNISKETVRAWGVFTVINLAIWRETVGNGKRRKRWKRNKQKEHRRITSIYKHRLKESEFEKVNDKYILKCKDQKIGMFLPCTPPPDLKKLLLRPIPWKKVDVLVKKETRLTKFQLLDNFVHSCVCCPVLRKQEFISHINKKHGGMVPPQSQINEPA